MTKSTDIDVGAPRSTPEMHTPDFWSAPTLPRGQRDSAARAESCRHAGVLVSRYELTEQLGAGGMAVVWSARDRYLRREVAIKLIRGAGGSRLAEQRARLLSEARAMARLSHPNVVTIHDAGATERGVFIVMERLDGGTLAEWLYSKPRSCREVIAKFIYAGRGLAAAHQAGLVHRDFKPDNVLIGRDGIARVSDFGLAFPVGEIGADSGPMRWADARRVTACGAVAGTLGYMPPEQLLGKQVTARSDQFSFCVAFYEALYSVMPFGLPAGDAAASDFLAAVVAQRFTHVPAGRTVPARLRDLAVRGLASDPDRRWPSMEVLVSELETFDERRRARPESHDRRSSTRPLVRARARLRTGPSPKRTHELLIEAVSTALRAEALALAVASRRRPAPLLFLGVLAAVVAATAITWCVVRVSRSLPLRAPAATHVSDPPRVPARAALTAPTTTPAGPSGPDPSGRGAAREQPRARHRR